MFEVIKVNDLDFHTVLQYTHFEGPIEVVDSDKTYMLAMIRASKIEDNDIFSLRHWSLWNETCCDIMPAVDSLIKELKKKYKRSKKIILHDF